MFVLVDERCAEYPGCAARLVTRGRPAARYSTVPSFTVSVVVVVVRNLGKSTRRCVHNAAEFSIVNGVLLLVMLAIAGAMALLLGLIGICGVISYSGSQRTRELIHLALGAPQFRLKTMVIRNGIWLAGTGAAVGLAVSAGLTRIMASWLYGISPLDPFTYAAVSLSVLAAAAIASYLPARRASTLDPVEALWAG